MSTAVVQKLSVDRDPTSCANISECRVQHMKLRWNVHMDTKIITGNVVLDVAFVKTATSVLLDAKKLKIDSVSDVISGDKLKYTLNPYGIAEYGMKLTITVPETKAGQMRSIRIDYSTTSECTGLQFLTADQTADKKHAYMFSQCQAIHARSVVPCMDTPAIKQKYSAKVSVPKELVALMSAVSAGAAVPDPDNNKNLIYSYEQKVPIPSYLLAIAVGHLTSRELSPRCCVWSEPSMIEACAYEFAETEKFLQGAIELLGEYVWGRYDLLVLPPSFPFGGMENPCLTFVTPTLLAGDRSLAGVLTAHEIAHSWTGNLVTNATFEHFWLNEGHTTFAERKIVGKLYNSEAFRNLEAVNGWKGLEYAVNDQLGATHPFTRMIPALEGEDPEYAFSTVPYEKGHALLYTLEKKLGGPAKFEPFLRSYITKFKYESIVTDDWKAHLYEFFKDQKSVLDSIDWNTWFNAPGLPVDPGYDDSMVVDAQKLAKVWVEATDVEKISADEYNKLNVLQKIEFLAQLLKASPLPHKKIEKMQSLYGLKDTKNFEIKFQWCRIALKAKWEPIKEQALNLVTVQGRMKFTRPIYKDLHAWDKSRDMAKTVFMNNKPTMHPSTAALVAKDLGI